MLSPSYPEVKQTCDPDVLKAIMQRAQEDSKEAIMSLRDGRIEPKPADEVKCEYCSFAHACRYEVAAMQRLTTISVGAAGEGQ